MTPNDISSTLPNGFHGARVDGISTDYGHRTATITLSVLVPKTEGRSRYRAGALTISGLAYCSLDVPDPSYDYNQKSAIEVGSLLNTNPEILPRLTELQNDLGEGFFFNSFFVEEWNGFIHFAGRSAELNWVED